MTRPAPPCTPEDFAALVAALRAELAAADRPRRDAILSHQHDSSHAPLPESFAGRPWTAATMDLRQAAQVTGYSWYTLHGYAVEGPSRARWWPHARFPPPVTPRQDGAGRKYRAGALAIWAADRDPRNGSANLENFPRRPRNTWKPKDLSGATWQETWTRKRARRITAATEFAAALVRAGPAITLTQAKAAAAQAGVSMHPPRQVMDAARAAALPHVLAGITTADPSGLASAREISDAFGVGCQQVRRAMKHGEIRAVRKGRFWLADPARLRYRKEAGRRRHAPAPVDQDHPAAVPLPHDTEEAS